MLSFLIAYPAVVLAFVLAIALAAYWFAQPSDRRRTEIMLCLTALAVPADALAEMTANALSKVRPLKYDLFVYRLDGFFHEPSFALGRLVQHHRSLEILVSLTYGSLPIVLVATVAAYLWLRSECESYPVIWTFVLNLFAAVPIYLLFPVCGPRFAFPQFPHAVGNIAPHLLAIAAAPNGVPSVHTSSALLVLWFLRKWRLGRAFGVVFLALTVLATLGSGQHYLFDLFCAVPYAAFIVAASPAPVFSGSPCKAKDEVLAPV